MHFMKSLAGLNEDRCSDVEKDLLSSTSDEVSELWDGEKVIRVIRPSLVSELFFTGLNASEIEEPYGLYTSQEAKLRDGVLEKKHQWTIDHDAELEIWHKQYRSQMRLDTTLAKLYPPNMMLNLGPYNRLPSLWAITILGVVLEGAVVMLAALISFYPPLTECFRSNPLHFYLFSSGTGLLSIGLVACAAAIDAATRDEIWKPKRPNLVVIWLQEGSEEEGIASYIIVKRIKTHFITSHRPREVRPLVECSPFIIASITLGFLTQAIGLSAMRWPPQLLQFLATMIMFICRSYLRRQDRPDYTKKIQSGCCKDWIAKMCVLGPMNLCSTSTSGEPDVRWKLVPLRIDNDDPRFGDCKCAQNLLQTRRFLANMTKETGQHRVFAAALSSAIDSVIQATIEFGIWEDVESWSWCIGVQVDDEVFEEIELTLQRSIKELHADEKELEALISLLLSSGIDREHVAVSERSILYVGLSKQKIARDLKNLGLIHDLSLYQVPPVTQFPDLRISVDKRMILGVENDLLDAAHQESEHDSVTINVQKISEPNDVHDDTDAALTRISSQTLGELYTQHIFVCFMWVIAKELSGKRSKNRRNESQIPNGKPEEDIQIEVSPTDNNNNNNSANSNNTASSSDQEPAGFLKRAWLKRLLRKIEFTRLGDMDFANLAVIPPLSYHSLLDQDDIIGPKRNLVSQQL
ncbi:hypothetical protein BJX70DRAFT_402596 [Aspergillus crustosus]